MPEFTVSHWPFIAGSYGFMAICILLELFVLRRQRKQAWLQVEFEGDAALSSPAGPQS